jgi:hypothetical protein
MTADGFFTRPQGHLPGSLGDEPTCDHFRNIAYSIANIALQLNGQGPLPVNEFMAALAKGRSHEHPGAPHSRDTEPRGSGARGLVAALKDLRLADKDPARECFMCDTPEGVVRDATPEHSPEHSEDRRDGSPADREKAEARLAELDELVGDAEREREALLAGRGAREHGRARARARNVYHRIVNDEGARDVPPVFGRASQNLDAAARLLRQCPEPETPEARWLHQQLKTLLEKAAVQHPPSIRGVPSPAWP